MLDSIKCGSKVTILIPAGLGIRNGKTFQEWKPKTGKAIFQGPGGWVLNMGGRHGIPGIATSQNIVRVK